MARCASVRMLRFDCRAMRRASANILVRCWHVRDAMFCLIMGANWGVLAVVFGVVDWGRGCCVMVVCVLFFVASPLLVEYAADFCWLCQELS